jgi:hypothetical protein
VKALRHEIGKQESRDLASGTKEDRAGWGAVFCGKMMEEA